MKKITIDLTDDEVKILEHDLLDIDEWIQAAVRGKINNCKKRAANEFRQVLKNENAETLPASDDTAVKNYFSRSDYKNRSVREERQDRAEKKEIR